eukprot:2858272-Rhodomonas_salina.1
MAMTTAQRLVTTAQRLVTTAQRLYASHHDTRYAISPAARARRAMPGTQTACRAPRCGEASDS